MSGLSAHQYRDSKPKDRKHIANNYIPVEWGEYETSIEKESEIWVGQQCWLL